MDDRKAKRSPSRVNAGSLVARGLLALVFVGGVFFSLLPLGRAAARSTLLLPALITQSQPAPLVLAGDPIRHTQSTIESKDGTVFLDIYAPTTPPPLIPGAREGVVVIAGVGDNRKVGQLVNLLDSMARAGLVVMLVTTQTLIDYELAPATSDALVQTVLALQRYPGVNPHSVGILGFSAGGSLAALAATDPRIQRSLAFITLFGSYYDARTLLEDFGRRAQEEDGKWVPWTPNSVPVQVLTNTIANTLSNSDGAVLRGGINSSTGISLSPAAVASLSPPAQAAYHLLAGDQPSRVQANLALLPPEMMTLLTTLSPSSVLAEIRAPIYLLHDRNDTFVPVTQSEAFAAKLAQIGHQYRFAEFSIFAHVEVKTALGIGPLLRDGATLYQLLTAMLQPAS
ncbi:MAG: alpha/beta hydrolase family protein [Ktedonobacterales bacterium]